MGRLTPCPQCGSEEPGFFCRFCGTKLLRSDAGSRSGSAPAAGVGAGASSAASATSGVDDVAGPYTQPLGLPPQPAGAAPTAAAAHAGADDLPPTQASAAYQPDHGGFGAQLAAAETAYQPAAGAGQEAYAAPYEPYQPAHQQQPWYPPDAGTGYAAPHSGGYPAVQDPYAQGEAAYPPQQPGASSKVLYGILGVLAACFVALGVWWVTGRGDRPNEAVVAPPTPPIATPSAASPAQATPSGTSASNPSPSGSATQPGGTAPGTSGPGAEQARTSLAALQSARDGSRQRVTLDGHWAAQLASKHDGIVDPLQTTASGSHTFGYPEILTEFEQLRAAHGDSVIVLNGTDFGRQVQRPKPVFVTLYDGGFASSAQAQAWCARAFPGVTGKALANRCVPRSLRAPYR